MVCLSTASSLCLHQDKIITFVECLLQAKQLLDVLEKHGPEYLETWRLQPLTWTELEELKANAGVPAIEGSDTGDG